MRGSGHAVLVAAAVAAVLLAGRTSFAQPSRSAPAADSVTLVAAEDGEPLSKRFALHVAAGLTRRGHTVVIESEASSLLGRPLSTALLDCTGDDLCFNALGQVVDATHVLVLSAATSKKDERKYECLFRVIDIRSGKTRGRMVVTVAASETGLLLAANTVAENVAPRPRIAAVVTPPPVIPAPTPVLAVPEPTPLPIAVEAVADPDVAPPPPGPRRRSLLRDPSFWAVAGAGIVAIGAGAFLGAAALQPEPTDERGTSTVEVRF